MRKLWKVNSVIIRPEQQRVPIRWLLVPMVIASYMVIQIFLATIPGNILESPIQSKIGSSFREVLPQGWAFFTKSVGDDNLVPYAISTSVESRKKIVAPNASPEYIFGWDRTPRAQGAEIAVLLQGIGKEKWNSCENEMADGCLAVALKKPLKVKNLLYKPTLCGPILLIAETTTPWEWRNLVPEKSIPSEALMLDVTCA